MVDHSALGVHGETFEMRIEQGKIREFAAATQSRNPAYWDNPAPVVPATFLTTQMFWEDWSGPGANPWHLVAMDQQRGMHAEQEFIFHGPPPRAGAVLAAGSRIEDIRVKEGRRGGTLTFATMVTEFRDETGRLVAEARMTGVETERVPNRAES